MATLLRVSVATNRKLAYGLAKWLRAFLKSGASERSDGICWFRLLQICIHVEAVEDRENVLGSASTDGVDSAVAVELRMPCVEPGADFVRLVILPKARHDPGEIGDEKLRFRARRLAAGCPTRHNCRGNPGEVRDVGILEAAGFAQALDELNECRCRRRLHRRARSFARPFPARRRACASS